MRWKYWLFDRFVSKEQGEIWKLSCNLKKIGRFQNEYIFIWFFLIIYLSHIREISWIFEFRSKINSTPSKFHFRQIIHLWYFRTSSNNKRIGNRKTGFLIFLFRTRWWNKCMKTENVRSTQNDPVSWMKFTFRWV